MGRKTMKQISAVVMSLMLAASTVVLAQEGGGQGPPHVRKPVPIVKMPQPAAPKPATQR
jgi:hypothetical protein